MNEYLYSFLCQYYNQPLPVHVPRLDTLCACKLYIKTLRVIGTVALLGPGVNYFQIVFRYRQIVFRFREIISRFRKIVFRFRENNITFAK